MCFTGIEYVRSGTARRAQMTSLAEAFPINGELLDATPERKSVVVYAATIGELTGAKSFLAEMMRIYHTDRLVIISGQEQYLSAISELYPKAVVGTSPSAWTIDRFLRVSTPRFVCILEGPCLHGRFPIKMDLVIPAACGANGIPLYVISASLHDLNLGCTEDRISHRLFGELHKAAVTYWYAPSDDYADALREAGARSADVVMLGDVKVSNIFAADYAAPSPELGEILAHYKMLTDPIIGDVPPTVEIGSAGIAG